MSVTAALVGEHGQALVFCRTRHGADRVTTQLNASGVRSLAIHGGKTQAQRERALAALGDGRARALVATDVAARGIHVEDLPCVVHYDPPADHTDYLHRSGRTGRAGKTGTVVSLVADEQRAANRLLQRSLGFDTVLDPRPSADRPAPAARPVAPSPRLPRLEEPVRAIGADRQRPPRATTKVGAAKAHGPRGRTERHPGSATDRFRPSGSPVGTVRFYDAKKGYGFLSRPDGAGDVFVHVSGIRGEGPAVLVPGQRVRFDMTTGRRGDKASNVTVI